MNKLIITILVIGTLYLALTIIETHRIDFLFSNYIGGGAIDLDPDLSPSYAYDFAGMLFYNTILPIIKIALVISALFLVPHFILKRKNIPSKPYLALILVGILLFSTAPNFIGILVAFSYYMSQPEQVRSQSFDQLIFTLLWQIVVLTIVGILLYRSSIIRNQIKKLRKE